MRDVATFILRIFDRWHFYPLKYLALDPRFFEFRKFLAAHKWLRDCEFSVYSIF